MTNIDLKLLSVDLESEGLRRLLVNACYWTTGLADKIPARSDVGYVGEFKPTWFGFGAFRKGMKPSDFHGKTGKQHSGGD